jgi:hypothetical protein
LPCCAVRRVCAGLPTDLFDLSRARTLSLARNSASVSGRIPGLVGTHSRGVVGICRISRRRTHASVQCRRSGWWRRNAGSRRGAPPRRRPPSRYRSGSTTQLDAFTAGQRSGDLVEYRRHEQFRIEPRQGSVTAREALRAQPTRSAGAGGFLVPACRVRLTLQPMNRGCDPTQNLAALLRHPVGSRAAFSPLSTILRTSRLLAPGRAGVVRFWITAACRPVTPAASPSACR